MIDYTENDIKIIVFLLIITISSIIGIIYSNGIYTKGQHKIISDNLRIGFILGIISIITFLYQKYFNYDENVRVFYISILLFIMFFLQTIHGLIFRKRINDDFFNKMNIIGGIVSIGFLIIIILFSIGYFD